MVAAAVAPPPANARFDYQIGEPYTPPRGVRVVSRDWFDAQAAAARLRHLLRQRVPDPGRLAGLVRPDERSAWPADLVLSSLGDDPNWGGEYLVDICTAAKRRAAPPTGCSR